MFTGLSAFPLTPLTDDGIDEAAYARLIRRLVDAGVDSIGALGSTGSYAYLSREERARAAIVAVENAGDVPVIVGVGALRTRDVLRHVEDAQNAGASAVLLAPMTYQPLTDDEVFGLYRDVSANLSVPLVVYDNPGTTHFHFADDLHARIAQLSSVASIKIPPVSSDVDDARARITSSLEQTFGTAFLPGQCRASALRSLRQPAPATRMKHDFCPIDFRPSGTCLANTGATGLWLPLRRD
jgi:4-hydroxy-tetrahydrodipicolinate synthase